MSKAACLFFVVVISLCIASFQSSNVRAQGIGNPSPVSSGPGANTISGHVFGESRHPLPDIYVELLDDVYTTLGRVKTNASGYYVFSNLSQGRFVVRALPYGSDYAEQSQDVNISNVSIIPGRGRSSEQVDFYLRRKSEIASGSPGAASVVFAQDVPEEARKLYEQGLNDLRDKKEKEAFENLKKALETFPTYFMALDRLGTEYAQRQYYEAAAILLTKAAEVNPKADQSLYWLGISQLKLKQTPQAIETLQRAARLNSNSINIQMGLGLAMLSSGKLNEAETHFKQAYKLGGKRVPVVHLHLATVYDKSRRYREEADELETYLKEEMNPIIPAEKLKAAIENLRRKG